MPLLRSSSYAMQLPVVRLANFLHNLEVACLELEVKKYRSEHYAPPRQKRTGCDKPDFASHQEINVSYVDIAASGSS